MDLKDALFEILGKTDYKITKIRQGEKIAEVLIGMDEIRNTLESDSDYVITQGIDSSVELKEKYPNYKTVEGMQMFSSDNASKASKKELIEMIEPIINHNY
jgi:FlaA1/EpsC-like NDP-sugar epimerase